MPKNQNNSYHGFYLVFGAEVRSGKLFLASVKFNFAGASQAGSWCSRKEIMFCKCSSCKYKTNCKKDAEMQYLFR